MNLQRVMLSLKKTAPKGYILYAGVTCIQIGSIYLTFLKDFIYLLLKRGGRREKKSEKHQCMRGTLISCLSHTPNWGPGPQPRHVPWVGGNWTSDILVHRLALNPMSHTGQGYTTFLKWQNYRSWEQVSDSRGLRRAWGKRNVHAAIQWQHRDPPADG